METVNQNSHQGEKVPSSPAEPGVRKAEKGECEVNEEWEEECMSCICQPDGSLNGKEVVCTDLLCHDGNSNDG